MNKYANYFDKPSEEWSLPDFATREFCHKKLRNDKDLKRAKVKSDDLNLKEKALDLKERELMLKDREARIRILEKLANIIE
ncbi:unnamed protein product [Rhizophagus irregularis]|uniref:Uncharacterized protein n=1 Tax=Rhizophagus irregularis TaxID=588596 RepID=A0A2I1GPS6_9GLOM|nr:hypothetical protein RhiirA4_464319 [Rhizophagus irregularis]CAB4404230.1 unnamed protein product [Rhizophagus irregularis]